MKNIINIIGSPKSFTTSAYDFIKNFGVQDLVKNNKESCYFFDNDHKNLDKNTYYIDGSNAYFYKNKYYKRLKENTILFLNYTDRSTTYLNHFHMNYECLDEVFSFHESYELISDFFQNRPQQHQTFFPNVVKGLENLNKLDILKKFSTYDIYFSLIFTNGNFYNSAIHWKKRLLMSRNKLKEYFDIELSQLRRRNFVNTDNILPVHLISWSLNELVSNFNNFYYISFRSTEELEKKLLNFLNAIGVDISKRESVKLNYASPGKVKFLKFPRRKKDRFEVDYLMQNKLNYIFAKDTASLKKLLESKQKFKIVS